MDSPLELGITLRVLPKLDALLFNCQEWNLAVQVHLSCVARLSCGPLGIEDITLSSWQEFKAKSWALHFKVHRRDHFNKVLIA